MSKVFPSSLTSIKDAVAALKLFRDNPGAYTSTRGRLSTGMIFTHLSQDVTCSMTGYPQKAHQSGVVKALFGKPLMSLMFFLGTTIPGHDVSELVLGLSRDNQSARDGLETLITVLTSFDGFSHQLADHYVYGKLSKAQYVRLHLIHIKEHLAVLKKDS